MKRDGLQGLKGKGVGNNWKQGITASKKFNALVWGMSGKIGIGSKMKSTPQDIVPLHGKNKVSG